MFTMKLACSLTRMGACSLFFLISSGLWGMEIDSVCDDSEYKDAMPYDGYPELEKFIIDKTYQKRIRNDHFVRSIALSPNGQLVATGDSEKVSLYLAATGEKIRVLAHESKVLSIAWSKNNKQFATGSLDNKAKLFCANTGKLLHEIELPNSVFAVALSPNGKKLATGSHSRVNFFDTSTGQELLEIPNEGLIFCIAFSPYGKRLAIGSLFKARIICAMTGNPLLEIMHCDEVRGVAFSPHGRKIATESGDDAIAYMHSTKTGKCIYCEKHNMKNWFRAFSADGKQIVCPNNNEVKIHRLTVLQRIQDLFVNPTPVQEQWFDRLNAAINECKPIVLTSDQWQQYQTLFPRILKRALRSYVQHSKK